MITGSSFCKEHKYVSEDSHKILKYHSERAIAIVDKGYRVTFDLIVKIGLLRFHDHRQLAEIKLKYASPLATLSDLKPGFLSACKDTFKEKVVFILCHYHFLRTFKDDFAKSHNLIKKYLTKTWKIKSVLKGKLKTLKDEYNFKANKNIVNNIDIIESDWKDTGNTLQAYHNVLEWILKFKQDSTGKGQPFDLPYLDFYNRLKKGEKLINVIFRKAGNSLKYYNEDFCKTINIMETQGSRTQEYKKTISLLKYTRKWFVKLRGTLFFGTKEEIKDALSPLSKRYHLSDEEAKLIPQNLEQYLKELEQELLNCQNPEKAKSLTRLKKQTEKYKASLQLPIFDVVIEGKNRKLIPPRTNNILESFFRLIKCLLRRNTGRSKLTKEFGSLGALLPFYVSMSTHKTFKALFEDEKRLTEEFASLAVEKLDGVKNVAA